MRSSGAEFATCDEFADLSRNREDFSEGKLEQLAGSEAKLVDLERADL